MGRDVNVSSRVQQGISTDGAVSLQRVERVAGLYVWGMNGELNLGAGNNLSLTAANVVNVVNAGRRSTSLTAGNAVNLQTLTESRRLEGTLDGDKQYSKSSQSQEIGSTGKALFELYSKAIFFWGDKLDDALNDLAPHGGQLPRCNALGPYLG